eukprot:Blabericola_migrator_1__6670@NODE_3369_length_1827_cov_7_956818_g2100_i0_p1_GENE_NODE_3369_length_1827_cov_7_956818_g2100_i0NODE_3369_length_1827_cov_7_956818_g2100_i0_p1_ORF_typecomplete_len117_score17_02_NODE_3369_length_1827_cov_7_956818_g2100_i011111461
MRSVQRIGLEPPSFFPLGGQGWHSVAEGIRPSLQGASGSMRLEDTDLQDLIKHDPASEEVCSTVSIAHKYPGMHSSNRAAKSEGFSNEFSEAVFSIEADVAMLEASRSNASSSFSN